MESLKLHSHLGGLRSKANSLTETGVTLEALFTGEGTRLSREDEASSLRAMYHALADRLQRVKEIEAWARHGHSQANLVISLGQLAVGSIMKMTSKSKQQSAIANYLLQSSTDKQEPFGLVMISIGPRGLPDDAVVVSISQLARESNRPESEVINALQEDGYLLFSEEAFSHLISRLVGDVREGRLRLPVSREKLAEITASNKPKLRARIIEVE